MQDDLHSSVSWTRNYNQVSDCHQSVSKALSDFSENKASESLSPCPSGEKGEAFLDQEEVVFSPVAREENEYAISDQAKAQNKDEHRSETKDENTGGRSDCDEESHKPCTMLSHVQMQVNIKEEDELARMKEEELATLISVLKLLQREYQGYKSETEDIVADIERLFKEYQAAELLKEALTRRILAVQERLRFLQ
jgi:hypothetical protein